VEPLTPGGFGVDLGWTNTYRQVLQAETILGAVEKVGNYTAAQKEGVRGFTKTFEALALMEQLRVRDTFGIVPRGRPDRHQAWGFRDQGCWLHACCRAAG
jgi:hypothetical protein